jgi:hypothetical protein
VVTVPAVWSDAAKNRKCSKDPESKFFSEKFRG